MITGRYPIGADLEEAPTMRARVDMHLTCSQGSTTGPRRSRRSVALARTAAEQGTGATVATVSSPVAGAPA